MRQPRVWISILILLVLGLHALPVLSYEGARQTRWPILAWAMYARPHPPGPIQMIKRRIYASTASGQRERVTPHLVGISKSALRNRYLKPMWLGDSATAQQLLARLNRGRDEPFVQVWVEGEQYTLEGKAVITEKFPVITYRMSPSAGR